MPTSETGFEDQEKHVSKTRSSTWHMAGPLNPCSFLIFFPSSPSLSGPEAVVILTGGQEVKVS